MQPPWTDLREAALGDRAPQKLQEIVMSVTATNTGAPIQVCCLGFAENPMSGENKKSSVLESDRSGF